MSVRTKMDRKHPRTVGSRINRRTRKLLGVAVMIGLASVAVPTGAGAIEEEGPPIAEQDQFPPPLDYPLDLPSDDHVPPDDIPMDEDVTIPPDDQFPTEPPSCDIGTLSGATLVAGQTDYLQLSGHEVNLRLGNGDLVDDSATVDYYYRGTCQIPYLVGGLHVSDIGPTCARVEFESLVNNVTVGSYYSEEICQDLEYGADYIDIALVGVGDPALSSIKVHTQIQDNTGSWINVDSVGRVRN